MFNKKSTNLNKLVKGGQPYWAFPLNRSSRGTSIFWLTRAMVWSSRCASFTLSLAWSASCWGCCSSARSCGCSSLFFDSSWARRDLNCFDIFSDMQLKSASVYLVKMEQSNSWKEKVCVRQVIKYWCIPWKPTVPELFTNKRYLNYITFIYAATAENCRQY